MNLKFFDYYDKVLGCYIGKNIGGTLGAPFECYRGVYDISWFQQDISESGFSEQAVYPAVSDRANSGRPGGLEGASGQGILRGA